MKSTSLSLARISISFASLCLALLAISIPDTNETLITIPKSIRLVISLAGTALIVGAGLLIDWTADSFSDNDWKELNDIASRMCNKTFNDKFQYFLARCRLFGGGYLLVCIGVSVLTYAMIWLFNIHAAFETTALRIISNLTAIVAGLLIFFKMMTRRSGSVMLTIIVISGFTLISIFGPSLGRLFS